MEYFAIKDELKNIIKSTMQLEQSTDEIIGEDLINELGINSVDALEILILVENQFDIQIDDDDLNAELISTIDGLAAYISRKLDEKNQNDH